MSVSQLAPQSQHRTITALGRGGMGEAYLTAMPGPPGVNELGVIKRIWPELADDPDFIAMFLDEATLALRLRHPNIVQTFDVGKEPAAALGGAGLQEGRYFIAMEYLAGQPLALLLERLRGSEAFGLQHRLHVLIEVLKALEYAHTLRGLDGTPLGVVHRDISPQNVFVTYDGAVKLMDFGIAKSVFASHQTGPGVFKGRFAYGAPEQLRGVNVDRRADLFAVGVMLWEMLADRRMFRGRTRTEVVRTLSGLAPLPGLPDDLSIPDRLRNICARALAMQPSGRYQSASEFRRELTQVAATLSLDPRPLGKVVASAFRSEKQTMDWLIERYFQNAAVAGRKTTLEWDPAVPLERPSPPPLPPPRHTASWRSSGSAPAIEISDVTIQELSPRRFVRWPQLAMGVGAVGVAVLALALGKSTPVDGAARAARPAQNVVASSYAPLPVVQPMGQIQREALKPMPAQHEAQGLMPAQREALRLMPVSPPAPPAHAEAQAPPSPSESASAEPVLPQQRARRRYGGYAGWYRSSPRLPRHEPGAEAEPRDRPHGAEGSPSSGSQQATAIVPGRSRELPPMTIDSTNPYRP